MFRCGAVIPIAMSYASGFVLNNPTEVRFGPGCVQGLGPVIQRDGFSRPFLLMGRGSAKTNGAFDDVVRSLSSVEIQAPVVCEGVRPNPDVGMLRTATARYKAEGCDCIIALGGGSTADSAKAIAAGVRFAGDVWGLFEHRGANIASAEPVYVVLTLSASGSERNGGAVAQDDAAGTKWSIRSDALFPRLSFVDPAHQRHLPWSQTTNGASDAVAHVLEHCVNSVDGRAEAVTLAVNEALVRQIVLATDRLQATPTDLLARTNLCLATTLALDGTSGIGMHGGAWHVHTLEHAVSALRPTVAHGAGLGVIFPAYMKHMHDAHPASRGAMLRVAEIFDSSSVDDAADMFRRILQRWGAPTTLRELGVDQGDLDALVESAVKGDLTGGVHTFTPDDARKVLEDCL
jgi:alcohol dehydrogenase YqhD (iron-dependent ADH family)